MSANPASLPSLATLACRIVHEHRVASISLLQRHLRLGYKAACTVMAELANLEVVRYVPGQGYQLDPHHSNRHPQRTMPDTRSLYVDKLAQTALFFFEHYEEENDGHTGAIEVLRPAPVNNVQIREQVLYKSYRARGLGLTEAALELHEWLDQQNLVPDECGGIQQAIRTACAPFERPTKLVSDELRKKQRAFRRLARYYWLIHKHQLDVSNDSRVPDYFIPAPWIHVGESVAHAGAPKRGTHPEHVVPCAFILRTCVALYSQEWSIDEISWLLQRLLAIVDITPDERDMLDKGEDNLKSTMPPRWDFLNGSIFARLHAKGIQLNGALLLETAGMTEPHCR